MAKAMKLHIDNDGKNYVCGLKVNQSIPEAVYEKDQLIILNTGELIDHTNEQLVCRNCIKRFHPTFLNDLLVEKELAEYKAQLPKSNRERARRNSIKRKNRNKAIKSKFNNVIQLPFVPVPQKPAGLIVDYNWRYLDKQAKVIEKPKGNQSSRTNYNKKSNKKAKLKTKPIKKETIVEVKSNDAMEDSFIQLTDNCAMVHGFPGYWKIIVMNTDGTIEDLSNWLKYDDCMAEVSDCGLKVA